ncbi:c-type cytochrome [Leisingera aquaemixtae]|uniref:Putative bifunctional cbb3-type cytochrome c oxidase subunit II/cytochrome c n=1 Tax=Leisingera aquaemixtae TaxID=1396826 RepID=A0A0P1HM94_9RHOB|nr:cytochrome c [Leisingera aquaemixtae]CUI00407.1 putative bifunctional cbb3-type cytochrome c oxidase subunit II/cytochrome c [Leisingera aquaemixtae]
MKKGVAVTVAAGLAAAGYYWLAESGPQAAGILPYQDPEAVALGEAVYLDHCASCHGADLQGEPNWQDRDSDGYLPAPPQDESGHTWHHPDAQLLDITRRGVAEVVGNGYRSRMGGFAGVLTEEEMLAVLAYIKSRWPAKVIARHNQINSQADN